MRKHFTVALLATWCASLAALAGDAGPAVDALVGTWRGELTVGQGKLETVFHLEPDGAGGLTGTTDSPAQSAYGMPISGITIDADGTVTIAVALTGGVYDARLDADGQGLTGTWKQRGAALPLACARVEGPPPVPAELRERLVGVWEGALSVGAVELRLVFHLHARPDGALRGAMDSPDQGAEGIAVTRVDFLGGDTVRIAVGSAFACFEAAPDEQGTLAGTFRQGRVSLPLSLKRVKAPTVRPRPQTPRPPFPYVSEDVTYDNEAGGVTLAGTLTRPEGDGPFPAAILITGSGAQDRDETIFEHKPFLVIADHLTRAGIAVLRVDDRGVGGSSTGSPSATTADFAGDVRAGLAFLRRRPEIDPRRVGLIGHSEGGIIAPMVAAGDPRVAFIVLLAGTGLPGEQILYMQGELLTRASGATEEVIAANRRTQEKLFAILKDDDLSPEEARRRMTAVLEADENVPEGAEGEGFVSSQLAMLETPWLRYFIEYDPAPALRRVRCPVLALNGTLDLQVPWRQNLDAIRAALAAGGNEDVTATKLPGLNHLFQRAETGLVSEYGRIEETVSPEALELMTAWILQRVGT